jgi:cytochrome c-type biogenesis protein CcmH
MVRRWLLWWLCACACVTAGAKEAAPAAADPALEARVQHVAIELRCLVCQNQTIADSQAGLADDLRREIREQLAKGATDDQVVQYMTDRYGDFIRYRPALKTSTAFLWAGPGILLVGGIAILFVVLRRRSRISPDRFEPDPGDEPADADVGKAVRS